MAGLNGGFFDRFSILHAAFGVWCGAKGFGFLPTLFMHTCWELFEAYVMEHAPADKFVFQPESFDNRVGDTLACLAGWSLNLDDRVADDRWVGRTNPLYLIYTPKD